MTAGEIVLTWYKNHCDNETHPFTIPDASLRALIVSVRAGMENVEAERDAEQLAPPTDEEES